MPKQHKPGNFKQSNKSYKGTSKKATKEKAGKILNKVIKKQQIKKPDEQQLQEEKKQQQQQTVPSLVMKQTKSPKIVAIIPFNQATDTSAIRKQMIKQLGLSEPEISSYITKEGFFRVDPNKSVPFLKQSIQFIFLDRNMDSILDACKVADIICPVLSCKNANVEGLALDPTKNAQAFDDFGYKILSCLRLQGLLPQVCLLQDLEEIPQNKKIQVKKLFTRYFVTEFGDDSTVVSLENTQTVHNLMRFIQGTAEQKQEWRDIRGYMLPEDLQIVNDKLVITGIWRGQNGISANQLIHITGLDDFEIDRIELVHPQNKKTMEEEQVVQIIRDENIAESLNPLCQQINEQDDITGLLLNQIEGLGLGEDDKVEQEMQNEEEEIEEQKSDVSYDDEDGDEDQAKLKATFQMERRQDDELEFEDEVEYNIEVPLRDRYKKYAGIKNFRNAQLDPYTFLPDEVDRIYNVKNLTKVRQNVLDEMKQWPNFEPGLRVRIFVKSIPQHHINKLLEQGKMIIVSGVLKHERKMTQMHVKIRKAPEFKEYMQSKAPIEIQVGFRRATVEPIYSRILTNTNKTKYLKTIKDDSWYIASFYFLCSFPPEKILAFQSQFDYRNGILMAYGDVHKCDTFQIIMKRVILTGYPFKINKKKAVIRLMFFNPTDVRYFKPVDLTTRLGLRGGIIESLGTHGLMKCLFNNYVKPNDTVCLHLYKRVHPRFPKTLQDI